MFDETVVGLYDAATDVDKWPAFIELMARLFEAEVSHAVYWNIEQRYLQLSWTDIHATL